MSGPGGALALLMMLAVMATSVGCGGRKPDAPEPPEALGEGVASLESEQPTAKTLYMMNRVLASQHRDRERAILLRKTLSLYPDFLPAYHALAELHIKYDNLGSAEAVLKKGLEIAPDDPQLLNNLGMCRLLQGDYRGAAEWFTRVSGVEPWNGRHRANLALALGLQGRYEEALGLYEQVVDEKEAYHNLSIIATSRGDKEKAAEYGSQAGDREVSSADDQSAGLGDLTPALPDFGFDWNSKERR